MAAPILALAGKFLAQQAASMAVTKMAGGGQQDPEKKKKRNAIIAAVVAVILFFVVSISATVMGLIAGVMSPLDSFESSPKGDDFCSVTTSMIAEQGDDMDYTAGVKEEPQRDPSSAIAVTAFGNVTRHNALNSLPDLKDEVLVLPIRGVTPRVSSDYGPRVAPTAGASTWHKGVDYAHPSGTPTVAIGPGVVVFAGSDKTGGNVVRIQHNYNGKTINAVYLHHKRNSVKAGTVVKAGDKVGEVGSTGVSTGPHLHFEIWAGLSYNTHTDPQKFFLANSTATTDNNTTVSANSTLQAIYGDDELVAEIMNFCDLNDNETTSNTGIGAGAWGGHSNGKIPASEMTKIPFAPHQMLRSDATAALVELNKAYKSQFGSNISITDSYRSYADQVRLKAIKGYLAATPGTSNHGWGLALDLGGGINSFGTPQHRWMSSNAPKYGWVNPDWAKASGSKPEPWHWEFVGTISGDPNADGRTKAGAQAIGRAMISKYGWNDTQFQCLDNLWIKESQWNYQAANPTSSAYGIPQALPGSKMASAGSDWKTNPKTQIAWGLTYIKQRYGTPCKAWDHSKRKNWY